MLQWWRGDQPKSLDSLSGITKFFNGQWVMADAPSNRVKDEVATGKFWTHGGEVGWRNSALVQIGPSHTIHMFCQTRFHKILQPHPSMGGR
jgi:hypothetical protein